jgi:hypothetical protein
MDNEIKPPGSFGPFIVPGDDRPAESKGDTSFAEAKNKLEASLGETPQAGFSFVSQHSKAELQDPKKLDQMVRASVSELIDSSQSATGPLANSQKASLLEFLSGDPTIRREIETYLRKVLA